MKKTIKEKLEEKYLRTVLVNDNALLIYTENEFVEGRVDIKVRYVDRNIIKEQYITSISLQDFKTNRDNLIEINKERTAIATYKIDENNNQRLDRLYMLDTHSFDIADFADIEYKMYFPENDLSFELIKKKRGNKNVKH